MLTTGIQSCDSQNRTPLEPGVSRELAEYRKSVLSDVRYKLDLSIPAQQDERIAGALLLSFALANNARPLVIDFRESPDRIRSVTVNGESSQFQFEHEHIAIPANELSIGRNEIAIQFTAGDSSLNRNPDYLYTLFVPDRARTVFPVFDQPDLKSVFELTLNIPADWTAMANAPLRDEARAGDKRVLRFEESDPVPSYLFAFVAGQFERENRTVNGRDISLIHRETDAEKVARNVDEVFRLHAAALDYLEEFTDIPYPYKKFDFALIPGFQYGGMEHVGAILYRSDSLFLDEDPSQSTLLGRASLIAHETAHMWFGNLVTMEWFDDVWTKEVYANFMAAKIVNPQFPDVNHDLSFLIRHHPSAYRVDRTEGANPIRQPLDNLNMAGQLYGPVIYEKAPIMMRQLEALLGEQRFRDGLREYLDRFRHGNAAWPDLIAILDRLTDQDLQQWSEVWVTTEGRPHFEVASLEPFVLRQEDPAGRNRIWPQRFEVSLFSGDESCTVPVTADAASIQVDPPQGCSAANQFLLNTDGMGYGLFQSQASLLARWNDLSDLHKGVLLVDLYENLLEQRAVEPEDMTRALVSLIPGEDNQQLINLALGRLETIYWSLLNDSQRSALAPTIEAMLWAGVTDPDHEGGIKRVFFTSYRDIAMSDEAQRRLYDIWAQARALEGLTLSESDYIDLAGELAIKNPQLSAEITERQSERIDNPDRKREFEFIRPALSNSIEERDRFFQSLMDERNRHTESWVRTALGYLHHPLRVNESERYLPASLEVLEELQITGDIFFPSQWLNLTLGNYVSNTAVETVRNFLAERPDYNDQLRMKILQAADGMFRANRILRRGN